MPLRIECYLPAFLHNLILLVLRGRPWALLQFSLAVARKLCLLFMQNNLRCMNVPDVYMKLKYQTKGKMQKIIAASIFVSSTSLYHECSRTIVSNVCSTFQKFG